MHDPRVPLTVSGNAIDGEVIYVFSVEQGRPTLRLEADNSGRSDQS